MNIYNDFERGIQFDNVTQGDFKQVAAGIMNHNILVVKEVKGEKHLAVAGIFEKAKISLAAISGDKEFSKERIIVAINSFIKAKEDEILSLPPDQMTHLKESLKDLQARFAKNPSLTVGDQGYLRDYSKEENAAENPHQRYVIAQRCLEPAISSVQSAIDHIHSAYAIDDSESGLGRDLNGGEYLVVSDSLLDFDPHKQR